jgi:hypothetical protein
MYTPRRGRKECSPDLGKIMTASLCAASGDKLIELRGPRTKECLFYYYGLLVKEPM